LLYSNSSWAEKVVLELTQRHADAACHARPAPS